MCLCTRGADLAFRFRASDSRAPDSCRKIYAVEQNQNRFVTLKKTIAQHGASKCVTPVKGDVLGAKIRREDINYILLDPSCSGTGEYSRLTLLSHFRIPH